MDTDEDTPPLPDAAGAAPVPDPYVRYLVRNREFTAPAVAAAIATLGRTRPGPHTRVLDAGTGGGGALRGLAGLVRAAGGDGTVAAVDADARAIAEARRLVDDLRLERLVGLRVADIRDVAAEASAAGGAFDLVWSSDVLWPTAFADPAEVVRALADALVPGGTLALFTTNYYQSMFLPGHSRLERLVRTASELTWALPADGPAHHERLGAWMRDAGLTGITLRVFPLVASPVTADPAARAYLEQIVWPEMRRAAAANGRAAGMTDSDLVRVEALLDPTGPTWIGADPTTYAVQPTLLWTGRAPAA